jgi:hypothetical protein
VAVRPTCLLSRSAVPRPQRDFSTGGLDVCEREQPQCLPGGSWEGAADAGEKTVFLSHLYIKTIILPRQAPDKHRENSKSDRFLAEYPYQEYDDHCQAADATLLTD